MLNDVKHQYSLTRIIRLFRTAALYLPLLG